MNPQPVRKHHTLADIIVNWALMHRVTVTMVFLAMVILGLVSFSRIPLQFMPTGFNPPYMGVFVRYLNANAAEVDEKIADPLVDQLRTLRGLRNARARSSDSSCFIFLEFNPKVDMDAAYLEARNLIERYRPDFPTGVDLYRIWKFNPDDEPILWLSVTYPEDLANPYRTIESMLQMPILRISGVGRVEIGGIEEPQVRIELRQDAVERHHINLVNLITRLRRENVSLVSGHIDEESRRYYIRSAARWESLDDIRNILVTDTGLRLKDIGEVFIGSPEKTSFTYINNRAGVTLEVYKESASSSVLVSQRVKEWLNQLRASHQELKDWKIETLFDEGALIVQSIRDLEMAGLYGAILATLILYFFLRNLRITLTIALAMPLSLTMTIIVMYFAGETLNLISMMGLMLAVGMVVDNAVVVVESIVRYRQQGYDRTTSSFLGTTEVGLAILVATGTTLVVFLPLILINDNVGFAFYMARLGFPVCVALVCSLVVALIFIPVGNLYMASGHHRVNRFVEATRNAYRRTLHGILSHRLYRTFAMLVIVILFASTFYPMNHVRKSDQTEGNIGDFRIIVEMPPNYTLEQADKLIRNVTDSLLKHKDNLSIRTVYTRIRSGWSQIRVFLVDKDKRRGTRDEIIERTRAILPVVPGVTFRFGWQDRGSASQLQVSIFGKNMMHLENITRDIAERIKKIQDVVEVEIPTDLRTQELHITVEDWFGQRMGINPFIVAQNLAFAVRGLTLRSSFPYKDDYIDTQIIYRKPDREDLNRVMDFKVGTGSGPQRVPLRSITRLNFIEGIGQIERENGRIRLPLTIHLRSDADLFQFQGRLRAVMDSYPWHGDYGWGLGDRWRSFQESQSSQKFALTVSIVLVFLLMGTLFESVVLPFCIMFSIPFAFVGTYWILYLTGTQFDLMAGIGLIILIGIVVNNAIVLIDRVNQLRHEGNSITDALVEGSSQRFRPIWMTALTTIMGMIPMALGKGELVGISYAPLARAVIGGLLTSTLATLIIVPLIYFSAMSWQQRLQVMWTLIRSRRHQTHETTPIEPS